MTTVIIPNDPYTPEFRSLREAISPSNRVQNNFLMVAQSIRTWAAVTYREYITTTMACETVAAEADRRLEAFADSLYRGIDGQYSNGRFSVETLKPIVLEQMRKDWVKAKADYDHQQAYLAECRAKYGTQPTI